jgi:CheY-like chemotaxis protein
MYGVPVAKPRVLVVDDDADLCVLLCQSLGRAGFDTVAARDGEDMLAMLDGIARFDVVLLDLLMPRMDGVETFRVISAHLPGVPVILMTGVDGAEALSRFEPKAFAGFLQKPFTRATLVHTVEVAVRQSLR